MSPEPGGNEFAWSKGTTAQPLGKRVTHAVEHGAESFGRFIAGRNLLGRIQESKRRKTREFNLVSTGTESLQQLEGHPFIIAANHVTPRNTKGKIKLPTIDIFVTERAVREATGRQIRFIGQYDEHRESEIPGVFKTPVVGPFVRKNLADPIFRGAMSRLGAIPLGRHAERFKREFILGVAQAVDANEPILIFADKRWHEDGETVSETRELELGTAHLARRHNIPIIPVYLEGCGWWDPPHHTAQARFGPPIDPAGKTKEAISNEIRQAWIKLQQEARASVQPSPQP